MKKLFIAVSTAAVLASTSAIADPIADRMASMKNVGAAMGASVAIMKGQAEFDPRVALLSFAAMNTAAIGFEKHFPAGSETGNDSTAKDTIWSDAAGFKAAVDKFRADTAAAMAAKPADLDSFKAAFGKVAANCKSCHEAYRIAKN